MSSDTVASRFVGQRSEYRLTADAPKIGDVLSRNGEQWEVVDVRVIDGEVTVTLRPLDGKTRPAS